MLVTHAAQPVTDIAGLVAVHPFEVIMLGGTTNDPSERIFCHLHWWAGWVTIPRPTG